jgi:hypothetical protein
MLVSLGSASVAQAGPAFYVDFSGSDVFLYSPGAFFNNAVANSEAGAYGLGLGLWTTFTNGDPPVEFQLGLQDRYISGSDSNGDSFGINAAYAVARLQLSRIYLGFGYSPYVMRSTGGSSATSQSLSVVSGASSMMGQLGFLMPITPKFSFGLEASYQTVSVGGVSSPSPIYAGSAFMRFYFGFGQGGGSRSSNEFRGWRYPFGKDLF